MTDGDLVDCAGVLLIGLGVLDLESNGVLGIDGVGRGVAVGRVYRLEVLSEEVSEVCDGVLGVADELRLGLGTLELLAIDVGEDGGDLTVTKLVGDNLDLGLA